MSLHFHTLSDRAGALAYFRSSDYYLEGAEAEPFWLGKGAERLGLSGAVDYQHFASLIDNKHPLTGERLTNAVRDDRDFARDVTVSLPKSVSVMRQLGGDERIAAVERWALETMFAVMERDAATRVRKGKADFDRVTGNLVAAVFPHQTSREPDPQDHFHTVILNLTFDPAENEWKAVQFRPLLKDSQYYRSVYLATLAGGLRGLGYSTRRTKDAFEIDGVPPRVLSEFSRRTKLIEQVAERLGIKNPESKAKLGATTRRPKEKGVTFDDLLERWEKRLKPGELEEIKDARSDVIPLTSPNANREAVDFALAHLLERKSVLREREVVKTALMHGLDRGATPEGVWAELGRPGLIRRDGLVTHKAVVSEEKRIVEFAVKGRGRFRPVGTRAVPPDFLSPSQRKAVGHVWQSHDRVIVVRGLAGVGKTTLTKVALDGVNVPCIALAPSAQASRGEMKNAGIEHADTLAAFLASREQQERVRGGLIWLDEASLASTKETAVLCQLADSLNARLVLSGDRRQFKSVGRGDVLGLLEDRGIPSVEVSDIRRQAGEYKKAVELLAAGRTGEAFAKLDAVGWIKPGSHAALVDEYVTARAKGEDVLIVAPTHKELESVTGAVRERLVKDGRLGDEEKRFTRLVPLGLTEAQVAAGEVPDGTVLQFVRHAPGHKAGSRVRVDGAVLPLLPQLAGRVAAYREDSIGLRVGDSIRLTANGYDATHKKRVNNGAVYTVAAFTKSGGIRFTNGLELGQDFAHLAHGYATTAHAAQGRSVDRVLISMPRESLPAVTSESAYVAVSRGKKKATIFTDDPNALREAWGKTDARQHASDLVREPRHKLREKLRRHVSWLRRLGEQVVSQTPNLLRGHHEQNALER